VQQINERTAIVGYRTILVYCDATPKLGQRLKVAVDLARRHDALLVGLHVQEPFDVPVFSDGTAPMDILYSAYEAATKANLETAAAAFATATKGTGLQTEWRIAKGYAENELVMQARYADLAVLGQAGADIESATSAHVVQSVAFSSGRPTLIVPDIGVRAGPGGTVMLCWNASRESARAASDALPFLTTAQKVVVLVVDPHSTTSRQEREATADISAWLARHGVKATVQRDVASDSEVGNVILSRAADHGIDLIVMGVYGHSRLREMVLGGASRTLLSSMTVPVLMAH
jgi:nucleotide-binding universal stress UspA family protein